MAIIEGVELVHGKLTSEGIGGDQQVIATSKDLPPEMEVLANQLQGGNTLETNQNSRVVIPYLSKGLVVGATFKGEIHAKRPYITSHSVIFKIQALESIGLTLALLVGQGVLPIPTEYVQKTILPPYQKTVSTERLDDPQQGESLIREVIQTHFERPEAFFDTLRHLLARTDHSIALHKTIGIDAAAPSLFLALSLCLPRGARRNLGFMTYTQRGWKIPKLEEGVKTVRFAITSDDDDFNQSIRFDLAAKQWSHKPTSNLFVDACEQSYQAGRLGEILRRCATAGLDDLRLVSIEDWWSTTQNTPIDVRPMINTTTVSASYVTALTKQSVPSPLVPLSPKPIDEPPTPSVSSFSVSPPSLKPMVNPEPTKALVSAQLPNLSAFGDIDREVTALRQKVHAGKRDDVLASLNEVAGDNGAIVFVRAFSAKDLWQDFLVNAKPDAIRRVLLCGIYHFPSDYLHLLSDRVIQLRFVEVFDGNEDDLKKLESILSDLNNSRPGVEKLLILLHSLLSKVGKEASFPDILLNEVAKLVPIPNQYGIREQLRIMMGLTYTEPMSDEELVAALTAHITALAKQRDLPLTPNQYHVMDSVETSHTPSS